MNARPNIVLRPRRLGGRLILERRDRAPAGGRRPRDGPAVPDELARCRRGPASAGARLPERPGHRGRALLRRSDHDRARRRRAQRGRVWLYIAAFGIDQGESLGALLSQGPPTPALEHMFTDKLGFVWLSHDDFVNHFAADVDPVRANVMYAVQQGLAGSAFTDVMGVPAWKSLPSWYLVATADQAIPPDAERMFASRMGATTVEVDSSHVAMVSHPDEVTALITTAADTCATPRA